MSTAGEMALAAPTTERDMAFWRAARTLQAAAASPTLAAPRPPADGWRRIEAAVERRRHRAWAGRIAAALVVGLGLLVTLRPAPLFELEPEPGPPALGHRGVLLGRPLQQLEGGAAPARRGSERPARAPAHAQPVRVRDRP